MSRATEQEAYELLKLGISFKSRSSCDYVSQNVPFPYLVRK